jgi:hypothetical protein
MNPYIRMILLYSTLFALLIISTMLIGRMQEQPMLFEYLGRCSGRTCYFGIIPGVTEWDDAVAIFENRPEFDFDSSRFVVRQPPAFNGEVYLINTQDMRAVNRLFLDIYPPTISVGSFVAQMGTPCAVGLHTTENLTIYYADTILTIPVDNLREYGSIKPTSLVRVVSLEALHESSNLCTYMINLDPTVVQRWKGFTRDTRER